MIVFPFLLFQMLSTETEGGLFDFNATLPLMALQFITLTVVLNFIFYKPVTSVLDERDEYIRNSLTTASASLVKADQLTKTYEQQLAESRKKAQEIIKVAQEQAQQVVSVKIKDAQADGEKLVSEAFHQLSIQKEDALKTLETQVDTLSDLIKLKLLND